MPTLTWIGKDKVVNHHHDVPYRVLEHKYGFRAKDEGNLLWHRLWNQRRATPERYPLRSCEETDLSFIEAIENY